MEKRFNDDMFRIDSLFFADNGMLLPNSVYDAEEVINRMENIYGNEFWLKRLINRKAMSSFLS